MHVYVSSSTTTSVFEGAIKMTTEPFGNSVGLMPNAKPAIKTYYLALHPKEVLETKERLLSRDGGT